MEMVGENVILLDEEQDMGGKWVKTKTKITTLPPVRMAIELLEGPMSGTKFFTNYSGKGNMTEVTVVGEFVSKTMPPAQVEPAARAFLEMVFNADTAGIRAFSAKKWAVLPTGAVIPRTRPPKRRGVRIHRVRGRDPEVERAFRGEGSGGSGRWGVVDRVPNQSGGSPPDRWSLNPRPTGFRRRPTLPEN